MSLEVFLDSGEIAITHREQLRVLDELIRLLELRVSELERRVSVLEAGFHEPG